MSIILNNTKPPCRKSSENTRDSVFFRGRFITATFAALILVCTVFCVLPASSASSSLKQRLDAVLDANELNGAKVSVCVANIETNKIIYTHNHTLKLIPASNTKIVTTSAALTMLKPDYSFKTEVYATSIKGSTVEGNLYIKGFGDPYLIDEELWVMARDLAYKGIKEIKGSIIADESYFDSIRFGEGWGDFVSDPYFAPQSALSLNFNTFVLHIAPGASQGAKAKLMLMPPTRHISITNKLYTVAAGGGTKIEVDEVDEKGNTYVAKGQINLKKTPITYRRTIREPDLYTAGAFEAYLNFWGVKTSGKIGRGIMAKGARKLVTHRSRPLSQVLFAVNKMSNNFVTEQVLKTLGAEFGKHEKGEPMGTTKKGIQVVAAFLKKLGVEPDEYVMADGSGMSRHNRFSSNTLIRLLTYMYGQPTLAPEFISSLGVGGVDGTIEHRFKTPSLNRRVRAKTGHLSGVNTLSGYLFTKKGKKLAFSILVNDFKSSHSAVEKVEQDFLLALSSY